MDKCITLEIEHPDWTIQQLADEIGKCYCSVWDYTHSDIYIAEKDKRLKELWHNATKIAQKQMIEMAKGGDFAACKYILSSSGYDAPTTVDITTNVIKVSVTDE